MRVRQAGTMSTTSRSVGPAQGEDAIVGVRVAQQEVLVFDRGQDAGGEVNHPIAFDDMRNRSTPAEVRSGPIMTSLPP